MNEPVSSATPGSQTSSTSSDSGECLFLFFFYIFKGIEQSSFK